MQLLTSCAASGCHGSDDWAKMVRLVPGGSAFSPVDLGHVALVSSSSSSSFFGVYAYIREKEREYSYP